MKNKHYSLAGNIFFAICIIILVSIIIRIFYKNTITKGNLKNDGFCILHNILDKNQIEMITENVKNDNVILAKKYIISNTKIKNRIRSQVGNGYDFQDYIAFIEKSKIHTCHRDYNGSFFNNGQKNKSYTMIFYLEPMERCLDIIPGSHKNLYYNAVNTSDYTKSIICKPGDAILFDANVIHSGSFNAKEDNMRIQMKVSHTEDIEMLNYYQDYNKVLNKSNKIPLWLQKLQKHASCQIPLISYLTQTNNISYLKNSTELNSGFMQKLFGLAFYGDSNFYDITNA